MSDLDDHRLHLASMFPRILSAEMHASWQCQEGMLAYLNWDRYVRFYTALFQRNQRFEPVSSLGYLSAGH